ncbi:helix-turn-helix domain-containing protein [Streptococcus sp.]|uniref:helix-turn-helix domain-containing protein n=1 Tax=Streptococcus sp. TaxID=1306 RepID=UPI003AB18FFE
MNTVKNRLKELRKNKGLTQSELANIINNELSSKEKPISKMIISNWENNKNRIKIERARQLANYFDVSVDYLLGYDTDPNKDFSDVIKQNMELFSKNSDDHIDFTKEELVKASTDDEMRPEYQENIIEFVMNKETTNGKLKLLSELVDNFKKS